MQETKYKAGDKVLIRPDLEEGRYYTMQGGRTLVANNDMSRNYAGRVVTIKCYTDHGYYTIKEGEWGWTDEMFTGLVTEIDEGNFKSFYDFAT